jgi:hypothetical protein
MADTVAGLVILPFIATNFLLMRVSETEDSTNTRYFLKSLPYTDNMRVTARFLFMFITLFLSTTFCLIGYVIFFPVKTFMFSIIAFSSCFFLVYHSAYIALHFRYSFFAAQTCPYLLFAILCGFFVISNFFSESKTIIFGNILNVIINISVNPLFYLVTVSAVAALVVFACYGEKKDKKIRPRWKRTMWRKFFG